MRGSSTAGEPGKASAAGHTGTAPAAIVRVDAAGATPAEDLLAVEEPLEIRVRAPAAADVPATADVPVAVTMRTPGHDYELAAGFLFTERFIEHGGQLQAIAHCDPEHNIVRATVSIPVQVQARSFYAGSSCGVCGKASIEAVRATLPAAPGGDPAVPCISAATLHQLPGTLRERQRTFARTGGLHAAALFATDGTLLGIYEDVGRHNALDKLIGRAVLEGTLPLAEHVVLFSGRTSYELVQKAATAGLRVLAAVGAPSSLAVQLADDLGISVVGFLRDGRFNLYCGAQRVLGPGGSGSQER